MTLKTRARSKFSRAFGKNFQDTLIIRLLYSRDIVALPSITKLVVSNIPDGVVLIKEIEDIVKVFQIANEEKIPVIPRLGATSGFGGCLPYKKGVVVDLKGLKQEFIVDPGDLSVTVSSPYVFSDLQRSLNMQGFSLCSYPSSLYSGTIGGWFAQDGSGIGALKYGGSLDQVKEIEVVLPTGEIKNFSDENKLSLFAGSQGTLGIITKLKLSVKFNTPLSYKACTYDSAKDLVVGLKSLNNLDIFSVWVMNPKQVALLNSTSDYTLPERYLVIVSKEVNYKEEESEFYANFNQTIRENKGQILDDRYVKDIWEHRFRTFSLLKNTKTFLFGEAVIPIDKSDQYIKKIETFFNNQIQIEGTMISPEKLSLLYFIKEKDEISDIKTAMLFMKFYKIMKKAVKYKGYPYTTGLWFSGYYKHIYGNEQLLSYKAYKKSVDPKKICNPGKVISPRLKIFPLLKLKTALKLASEVFG